MTQDAAPKPPSPATPAPRFTFPPALDQWNLSMRAWLQANDKHYDGLHASALVYDPRGRTLLLQRAAHDSMPNRWEPAGGAVDDEDETILHACARELREEAGLVARRVVRVVPETGVGDVFTNRTGRRFYYRFVFEVEVEDVGVVRTDPEEHSRWVWATEDEVRAERTEDGTEMPFTAAITKKVLLEGFEARAGAGS
ncbi:hypothetical protein ACO1O0_007743 [Amphichorda felina]